MLALLTALRPKQWIKNLFVFMPLVFAGAFTDTGSVLAAGGAFFLFSLAASAGYLINDAQDIEVDRLHPRKRLRPIAAGLVSVRAAYLTAAVLIIISLGGGWLLSPIFALTLFGYLALTASYSYFFKHIAGLDVLLIALGFVLRVVGGSVAIFVEPSEWLLGLTFLLALLLATGKRLQEVSAAGKGSRKSLDGYTREGLLIVIGGLLGAVGASYLGYLLFVEHPTELLVTLPFVWIGLARYFFLIRDPAHTHDGPTELFFADGWLQVLVVGWMAAVLAVLGFLA